MDPRPASDVFSDPFQVLRRLVVVVLVDAVVLWVLAGRLGHLAVLTQPFLPQSSAGLLDQVMVEAYGSTVPLNQVAAVSVPEPRSITVSVWDNGMVVSVEKAIR